MTPAIHIHRDAEAAALAAAQRFVDIGRESIERRGRFCVALSGGATPAGLYGRLAGWKDGAPDWLRVHVFFSDERCVPADHPGSNHALVRRSLLDPLNVPERNVYRIEAELSPPARAAECYDHALRAFFSMDESGTPAGAPTRPTFDLVLLGAGADGHTASLFPDSPAIQARDRWAVHTEAPAGVEPRDRITLTLPVINAGRRALFLVTGAGKSPIVGALLAGRADRAWPATMIHCAGGVEWHVDEQAAQLHAW